MIVIFFEKPKADMKQMSRLTVIDGEMQQKTVTKSTFFQFNDKRFLKVLKNFLCKEQQIF